MQGTVWVGPTRRSPDGETRTVGAYRGPIAILDDERRTVIRVETDAGGRFEVAVAPGRYIVQPEGPEWFPCATPGEVTVEAGRVTHFGAVCQTGIR